MKQCFQLHAAAAAMATALATFLGAPASAANIVLYDPTNSFGTAPNGAEALLAFQKAANYWNQTLTNNTTVRVNIAFAALDPGVLGSTGSTFQDVAVTDIYGALAHTGTSALDAIAVANLPRLNPDGSLKMRINDYFDPANKIGIDTLAPSRLSNGGNYINKVLSVNTSTIKALGLAASTSNTGYDANITFSSSFAFDFNPSNGISNGSYDFTAVAVHELGHALGFVSGTDTFDIVGHPNGPLAAGFDAGVYGSANIEDFSVGSTLDLYRYGNGFNADGSRQLQWGANKTAFFSIDGQHVFNLPDTAQEAAFFSTGEYNGDGSQASHWKDNLAVLAPDGVCFQSTRQIGVMDPTIAACAAGSVTQNDLAAFDAMGWNLDRNILAYPNYNESTKQIYELPGLATVITTVPEPDTYALLLSGLGLTGLLARRRKAAAKHAPQ